MVSTSPVSCCSCFAFADSCEHYVRPYYLHETKQLCDITAPFGHSAPVRQKCQHLPRVHTPPTLSEIMYPLLPGEFLGTSKLVVRDQNKFGGLDEC